MPNVIYARDATLLKDVCIKLNLSYTLCLFYTTTYSVPLLKKAYRETLKETPLRK